MTPETDAPVEGVAAGAPAKRRLSKRTLVTIGVAAAVTIVGCGVVGITYGVQQNAHAQAVQSAETMLSGLEEAETLNAEARDVLQKAIAAHLKQDPSVVALVTASASGGVSEGAVKSVETARAALNKFALSLTTTGDKVVLISAVPTTTVERTVDTNADEAHLESRSTEAATAIAAVESDTAAVTADSEELDDLADRLTAALEAANKNAQVEGANVLAANPSADQASKDALTNALDLSAKAAKNGKSLVAPLSGYFAAVHAVSASNAAALGLQAPAAPAPVADTGAGGNGSSDDGSSDDGSSDGGSSDGGSPAPAPAPAPAPEPAPAPAPAPAPEPEPAPAPEPEPIDTNVYVTTNSFYTPGCDGIDNGSHSPGPGGTSSPDFPYPWDYYIEGGTVYFVGCF